MSPDVLAQLAVEGRDRIVIGWDVAESENPRTAAWRAVLPPRFGPMQGVEKRFRYE